MTFDMDRARKTCQHFALVDVREVLPAALDEIERLHMAFSDLADDICGLQPVGTPDDAISAISRHDFEMRCRLDAVTKARDLACDIAKKFVTRMLGIAGSREYRNRIDELRRAEVVEMQRIENLTTQPAEAVQFTEEDPS